MEEHLGRKLLPTEIVHHKDHNKLNNDISNLELFSSHRDHVIQHRKDLGLEEGEKKCKCCNNIKKHTDFPLHGKNKGVQRYNSKCFNCLNNNRRDVYRKKKMDKFFKMIKHR